MADLAALIPPASNVLAPVPFGARLPRPVLSYEDSGPRLAHRFEWYAPPGEWAHVRRARGAAPLWEANPEDRRDNGPSTFWRPWWDAVADFGAGVLIVAHDTKAARNEARAGIGPGPGAVAGSGQWSDGARAVLHLSAAGPGDKRLLAAVKSNYGPSGWGARLAPRWEGDRWRGLELDTGRSRLTRERVAATRKEWATVGRDAKPNGAATAAGAGLV